MNTIHKLAAIATFLFAGATLAQTADPGINARQENQKDRIQQGVHSGELTRHEAKKLRTTERGIRAEERAFKSDGTLDKTERKVLHQDLNQANRQIYRQKHDAQKRPPHPATPAQG
jgi:uncharacterized membrane protein YebE (DUF533 family)